MDLEEVRAGQLNGGASDDGGGRSCRWAKAMALLLRDGVPTRQQQRHHARQGTEGDLRRVSYISEVLTVSCFVCGTCGSSRK